MLAIKPSSQGKALSTADKNNGQKKAIAVLDGVRAVACFTVVAYHINLITSSFHDWQPLALGVLIPGIVRMGAAGVTLFFVLSGFLLFMPYAKALLFGNQWPSLRQFYLRRSLRILPGYYLSLGLIILWMHQEYLQPEHWKELGLFLTLTMDSSPLTFQKLNGPFWTLAVEWQYYLLLPFLAIGFGWLVNKLGGKSLQRRWWTLIGCLAFMACWGVSSRYWGPFFSSYTPHHFPPIILKGAIFFLYGTSGKYLEDFAVGMLISSCYIFSQQIAAEHPLNRLKENLHRYSSWLWGTGILTLLFMACWTGNYWYPHIIPLFDSLSPSYNQYNEIGPAVGYGLCVLALLFGSANLRQPLEWLPVRWLGHISYSLYMWHLPILISFIAYAQSYVNSVRHLWVYSLYWVCVIIIIIPFSYVFYLLIEQPWIRLGNKIIGQKRRIVSEKPAPAKDKRERSQKPDREREKQVVGKL
ncbi:MAG TPA: acyltransferase [Ktedonosporobacter sp.]|jgi:peptidoglycan/LPS O-acetylase OafA/YrhL|nr:acyltransferase [Ktedonosporobacter sp.]